MKIIQQAFELTEADIKEAIEYWLENKTGGDKKVSRFDVVLSANKRSSSITDSLDVADEITIFTAIATKK